MNATVDLDPISTPVMFQAQNREKDQFYGYLKRFCVLQDHCDDERDKTVFHNTTPDLQGARPRPIFFSLRPVLSRPDSGDYATVSAYDPLT